MRTSLRAEQGQSAVELLVVCALLAIVLGGLANIFVSGTRAQRDTSGRVDAQQGVRLALDRLEYEARCSSYATIVGSGAGVTLTLPSQCSHASGTVTWCVSSGALMRYAGGACSGSGVVFVRAVTTAQPFSLTWSSGDLPRLGVSMTVNDTGPSSDSFTVDDTIALRNATVALGAPSPTSGAVGSSVTITGSYFKPSSPLTVTVGSTTATITAGGTSGADGSVNVTFTVPFSGNGSYNVTVSDGTNTVTSPTQFTVTGSFDGLGFTSTSKTPSCGTIQQATTCTVTGLGATGAFSGKPTLETASGTAVGNASGAAVTVTSSVTNEVSPGATVSPSSSSIATGASASGSAFTLTGLGSGWQAVMTCTLTVNGVPYSIAITGSA
ncbi:MAG TPA: hypothetical protein VFA05_06325 [Gaiellaceae bacterium]|jgi:hypothetical protein|nr:hypothetical protein [Gaiellaceae bacterium]